MSVYDTLKERGLIAQVTHEEEIRNLSFLLRKYRFH